MMMKLFTFMVYNKAKLLLKTRQQFLEGTNPVIFPLTSQEALVRLSLSIIPIPLKQNILFLYIKMNFERKNGG